MQKCLLLLLAIFSFSQFSFAQSHDDEMRSGARTLLAPFYHGVASGDPLSDAVIIWTRVTTDSVTVDVDWRMATDTGMTNIVASGMVTTDTSKDHTVKVDVTGLQPDMFYYYEFTAYGTNSIRGRTRTAPLGDNDSLRFAIVSCSNYGHGYFNVYSRLKERNDINAVLHLGDYIYEYGTGEYGDERPNEPANEILDLNDYRMRHSYYKLDEDLIRVHQQYPFICIWDDHETANDAWYGGAQNHSDGTEGDWFDRKAAGVQAYYEWMPLRMPDPADTQRIYRQFSYGDLVDLYMLDTRLQGREEQDGTGNTSSSRTLLGQQQFDWLTGGMKNSTAQWQIIGQQVMMAPLDLNPLPFGGPFYPNGDQWDGYQGERNRLYDSVFTNNIQNMVVLTGDIHTAWANDLPTSTYNSSTGAGSAGVEFVTTSVTSPGLDFLGTFGAATVTGINDHMKYANLDERGYYILDINKTRAQADYYVIDRVDAPSGIQNHDASWQTIDGSRHLSSSTGPATANANLVGIQAPLDPRETIVSIAQVNDTWESVVLGAYPNPFEDAIIVQCALHQATDINVQMVDALGRVVFAESYGTLPQGTVRLDVDTDGLVAGTYYMIVRMGDKVQQRVMVKN